MARGDLGLTDADFVLVTASRLARWKRTDRAVDAVALLKQQGSRPRLLVVGDGEERINLEQQADVLGLREEVRFIGAVPQSEVPRYLWAAGDTRDLIKDRENGVLLQETEPPAIAAALAGLAAEPERRQRLAAAALAFAQRNFWSWQERLDTEVDAIEALVLTARQAGSHV
jgi:glycosyltransferase involved in cell wall biosynthesis